MPETETVREQRMDSGTCTLAEMGVGAVFSSSMGREGGKEKRGVGSDFTMSSSQRIVVAVIPWLRRTSHLQAEDPGVPGAQISPS